MAIDQSVLASLRTQFNGRLISPEDTRYDEARTLSYGGMDPHPEAIVLPGSAEDIAAAIRLARENNLELAVRSGGHSVAGHSTTSRGIVLDLKEMKKLEIDPAGK